MSENNKSDGSTENQSSQPEHAQESNALRLPIFYGKIPLIPLSKSSENFGRLSTCLDADQPRDRAMLHNAIAASDDESRDMLDVPLAVSSWVCWDAEWPDEVTGEIKQGVRWTLILESGESVSGTGEQILSALRLICASEGPGPWSPPIPVIITAKITAKKRTVYLLKRVVPSDSAEQF